MRTTGYCESILTMGLDLVKVRDSSPEDLAIESLLRMSKVLPDKKNTWKTLYA